MSTLSNQKIYNISYNVGTVKYVVNFHDGIKTHQDGSLFFDIALFSNKKKMNDFIKQLKADGYIEESLWLSIQQKEHTLIISDYQKYAFANYQTDFETLDDFHLGEVVYDQCGQVGIILAFYKGNEVRLNSNGVCDVEKLRKCSYQVAVSELRTMAILRPSISI